MPKPIETSPIINIPHVESLFTPIGTPSPVEGLVTVPHLDEDQISGAIDIDRDLVPTAMSGDDAAFGEISELLHHKLQRRTKYRIPSHEDAEDLVQETFLNAFKGRKSFTPRPETPVLAWLYTINGNVISSFFRRRPPMVDELQPEHDRPSDRSLEKDPYETAVGIEDTEALQKAIAKLKPTHQQVIALIYIQGLSGREVATALGKTEITTRVTHLRAIRALRYIMENQT